MTQIHLDYNPRKFQKKLHNDPSRFKVVVLHRRAGKTVFAIYQLIIDVLNCQLKNPKGAYIAPYYSQAKRIAWQYLQDFTRDIPGMRYNQAELTAIFPNGAMIYLAGGENYHSLRGIYLDSVVLDEYAQMPPAAWPEVIRPALADRKGRAVFIGTPLGHNAFYDIYQNARSLGDWSRLLLTVDDTGIIDQAELDAARAEMTEEEYQQEFLCSWSAAIRGAYYGKEMAELERLSRITTVSHDPVLPVVTSWDLGVRDSTVIWFWQVAGSEIRAIDCMAFQGAGLPDMIKALREKPYNYSQHIAPHDIKVRELGSGRSRFEIASSLGINFEIAPKLSVMDGIHSVRSILPRCWFDIDKCATGIEALKQYRAEFDERTGIFRTKPLHNWCSDFCLSGDSLIDTTQGKKRIDAMKAGDIVVIGGVSADVLWAGQTQTTTTITIHFDDNTHLECTKNHKLFTTRGLIAADSLRYNDCVLSHSEAKEWSASKKGIREGFSESFRAKNTDIGRKENFIAAKQEAKSDTFIESCGNIIMETLKKLMPSSLLMETGRISVYPIGFAGRGVTTGSHLREKTKSFCLMAMSISSQRIGIITTRLNAVESCAYTERSGKRRTERSQTDFISTTRTVTRKTIAYRILSVCRKVITCGTTTNNQAHGLEVKPINSNLTLLEKRQQSGTGLKKAGRGINRTVNLRGLLEKSTRLIALFAAKNTKHTIPTDQNIVAGRAKRVVCVKEGEQKTPVYDLTVDHHHCYVANGVLVSNCDSIRYFAVTPAALSSHSDWGSGLDYSYTAQGVV